MNNNFENALINKKIDKKAAIEQLWRRGVLSWKLDSNQKDLYKLFHESDFRIQTWLLSRRSGKTYTLSVIAIEQCLKKPNSIVKFVAPTRLQITTILRPLMKNILKDCPDDLKPHYNKTEYTYYFSNGSEIQLAGSDNGHIEKLRGGDSDICIVDEAGDVGDLKNAIEFVLLPTTLITKGKILISGTPPKTSDHDFIYFIEKAEMEGSLIKRTVYDNPRLKKEDIEDLINELGGINSTATRRELFCEIIKDENLSVIPEFTSQLEKEIVKEWKRPPFFDCYVGMDLGMTDFTAVLFAYYDFRNDKIIIEDEYDVRGSEFQLPKLVEKIKEIEKKLWYNSLTGEVKTPYLRVSDTNPIALSEIQRMGVRFIPAKKDDNETAINNLRVLLANKKIIINPKCVNLIRHLRNVKWASNKKTFARSPDCGHYDYVDALKYLVRHIDFRKNPYPPSYDLNLKREDVFYLNNNFNTQMDRESIFKKIFNIKR